MDSDMVVNEKTVARITAKGEGRAEAEGGAGTRDHYGTNADTGDTGIRPVGQSCLVMLTLRVCTSQA